MFFTHECPICEYDMILSNDQKNYCPLCALDNGREVLMTSRPAESGEVVEGPDERKLTKEAENR